MATVRRLLGYAAFFGLAAWAVWSWWSERPVRHGPGVLAPADPVQTAAPGVKPFACGRYTLTPRAAFAVRARVLSTCRYRFDSGADLCPLDLALGWGCMSDEAVLKDIRIDQYRRYFVWGADRLPVPREDIERHAANMHIIPADETVRRTALACRVGNVVRFSGWLVNATGPDGFSRTTSMSREDVGANACEVVFVRSFAIE